MNRYARGAPALLVAMALSGGSVWADEREDLEIVRQTTINLIFALVEKGVLTNDAAQALVKQAEEAARKKVAATATVPSDKVVRVPYVPESVKREIREQIKQEVVAQAKTERWGEVNAIPEWIDRLKWEGDIRVRYQNDRFSEENAPPVFFSAAGQPRDNTTEDRNRARIRARLGLLAQITPGISAGFRLTTGNTSDPVSTNQTLGNYENKYSLVFDRAYLKLDPWQSFSVTAGRIPNPYFSTDLVWDEDINFEGIAASFGKPDSNIDAFRPFATLGGFVLQDLEKSDTQRAPTKWFWGAQGGFEWRKSNETRVKLGLAYYDYRNVNGIPNSINDNAFTSTVPVFRQGGNTVFDIDPTPTGRLGLASDFNLVNLTGSVDLAHFDPVHVILTGDYVRNTGYDQAEINARTGLAAVDTAPKVTGWQGRLTVGMPAIRERHDWQVFGGYRYLQRDAVLDAFTDSDFHLGGTDNKGYFIGGSYGLDKNTWLSVRWLSADEINGLPLAIDVLQVDLNAKF